MNTAIELMVIKHDEDLTYTIWYFPEELKVRIYLNNWHYDTINLRC